MQLADRVPPQDLDAERSLLGGLFNAHLHGEWADCDVDEIRGVVSPEALYAPAHRVLFKVICQAVDAGEPIDQVGILARLKRERSEGVDWNELIRQLCNYGEPANGPFYARCVRRHWQMREIIRVATDTVNEAFDPIPDRDPRDLIANVTQRLDRIAEACAVDREPILEADLIRSLDNPRNKASGKVPIGIGQLGFMLDGGLEVGSLTVIGARPSCGKTSMGLGLCVHAAKATDGCASLFASCEMTTEQIGVRLLSTRSRIPVRVIRSGEMQDTEFEPKRNEAALEASRGRPVYVLDGTRDLPSIVAQARRYIRRRDVRLVVVDYLQLCSMPGQFDRHDLRVGAMTAALKALAVETKTAVVALSQLNRAPEREGRKPQLADLRDSGSIEQDADVILFLHKSGVDPVVPDAQIIIAKHRQGDTGEAQVSYHKPTMTYQARHMDPVPGQVLTEGEV